MLGHLGKIMVREHRDMAEQIVEAVGRLEIIELVAGADEIADREHALAQHGEEDRVGHQPRHRDGAPAGARLEDRVELPELGHARVRQPQQVDPVKERRDDAGAEQIDLAGEQQVPHRMVLAGERFPALRDDIVLPAFRAGRSAV